MTGAIRANGLRNSFGGQTTTVQIMSALVHAHGGEVRVAGHDLGRPEGMSR
jgi:ABC-type multidrug transport system ATPase subunit